MGESSDREEARQDRVRDLYLELRKDHPRAEAINLIALLVVARIIDLDEGGYVGADPRLLRSACAKLRKRLRARRDAAAKS